tara:strand:+ start:1629 stop:2111 length:483 start_codon:yes stop_codon:yes gene_type:complete
MNLPKKYYKKCGDFIICGYEADKGSIGNEYGGYRTTLYQIVVKGSGKIAKLFDSNVKDLSVSSGRLVDLKDLLGEDVVFQFTEDTEVFGFNTLDVKQDWNAELITDTFTASSDDSWIVCFDGKSTINDKDFEKYDYGKVTKGTEYKVTLNNSILVLFTKV